MKINRLHLTSLRNDEFFQFMTRVRDLVRAATPAALRVEAVFADFEARFADLDEALRKIVKSARTAEIAAADRARDGVFRGLANAVRSARDHYNPAMREAGVRVGIVFDTYGNVAAKADDEETAAVYNLLVELTTRHAADCEALGLTGWIGELDRCNVTVERLMRERFEETTERSGLVMRDVRLAIGEVWYALADRVDALQIVEGGAADSPWAAFIAEINAIAERTENIVAERRGRAAAKKEREAGEAAAAAGVDVDTWRAMQKAAAAAAIAARKVAAASATAAVVEPAQE
ncbi:MAG: DUF6261 family protein [Alistipes sp.]|jgi:hypothetical protein|nr:DUF6261 family protein [Alistipes sp.]